VTVREIDLDWQVVYFVEPPTLVILVIAIAPACDPGFLERGEGRALNGEDRTPG